MSEDLALRGSALLLWLTAAGFGLPCLWGIWHLHTTGDVGTFMGYPTYGHGPFERHGITTTVPLLVAFLVVCVLEAVAGLLIWEGHRDGGILALVLLPVEGLFWWGFALPIPPIFAIIRTVLLVIGWGALH